MEYMTTLGAGVPTEFWSFAGRQPDAPENEPFLDWLYVLGNTTNPPLVFSTSYGEDETSVELHYAERLNQEFQKNSLRGVSFLFASGDSGVGAMTGACDEFMPMYPADSPYVTAVGATTQVGPETGAGLSSGGFSNRWVLVAVPHFFYCSYCDRLLTADGPVLPGRTRPWSYTCRRQTASPSRTDTMPPGAASRMCLHREPLTSW